MTAITDRHAPLWRRIFTFIADRTGGRREPNSPDKALMDRLNRGDPNAAEELVTGHADALYRFVYHQVGGIAQDAEDIVQETFLAAVRQAGRFRGQSRLRTWLFSIASHKVADHWRRQRRRAELPLFEDHPLVDKAMGQEGMMERVEQRQMIRAALLRLPPHYRTALVLRYVEGLSVAETAEIMHRSLKSVESILVRARRRLAELLKEAV
jgi:RNA polymerase sigma-70 factor (ECF subfamily)